MTARRVRAVRRRRRAPTASASTTRAGPPWPPATSSSTRPRPSRFDSPLDAAVEVNLLGPTRIAAHPGTTSGCAPHLVAVSTCYVAGNRRGSAPEILVDDDPFFGRRRLASRGRGRPARPQRRRGREPHPRAPRPASEPRPAPSWARPAPRCWPTKTEQLRARWVSDRLVEAGRARAASLGWPDAYAYTKALGERALARDPRRRAGQHRATVDHRVRAGRADAGLDPRLPHGRAGHHQLRPGPAQGVPRRARGHRRRHPRRPGRRRPSSRWPPGAPTPTSPASPCPTSCRWRRARPTRCATGAWSTWSAAGSREHPLYDSDGPAHRRARLVVPRPRPGAGPAPAGPHHARARREAPASLPLRGQQAELSATRRGDAGKRPTAPWATSSCTAPTPSARPSTGSIGCSPCGTPEPRGPGRRSCFDPRAIDWDALRHRDPPAVGGRARPGPHHPGRAHRAEPRTTRLRPPGPRARAPAGGVRPREHAHRVQRGRVLLVAGHPPAARRRPAAVRAAHPGRGARRCWRSTARTAATSSGSSTAATRARPSSRLDEDAAEMFSQLILAKSFPAAIRRVREHRAPGPPHGAHHRRARLRGRAAARRCSTTSSAPRWACGAPTGAAARPTTASSSTCRPPARPGPRPCSTTPRPTASTSRESVAYADSTSDLPMLEAVGFPVAVNPETRLAALARKRGWLVEHWAKAPGAPRALVPIGERRRRRGGLANPLVSSARRRRARRRPRPGGAR